MAYRPVRLFAVKFLGLWGGLQTTEPERGGNDKFTDRIGRLPAQSISAKNATEIHTKLDLKSGIDASSRKIVDLMLKKGIPGLTICVSVDGKTAWRASFGFCDIENQVTCVPEAGMRIASISKSIFASTVVAPMIEQNRMNIKSSIHQYLTLEEFPRQKYQGKEHDITVQQLLSHTSGIQHYDERSKDELRPICSKGSEQIYQNSDQYDKKGYFQVETFRNVFGALKPFKDGPLESEPGKFKYTTYGYTVLSAVAQKIHQKNDKTKEEQIEDYWVKTLQRDWGLRETYLDHDETIISNRARYYLRTGLKGALINAPYVNNSVKWAGGGLVSTANDLVKFGNLLIDSYKGRESAKLKRETIDLLWKEVTDSYGLGFVVKQVKVNNRDNLAVSHTGSAVGASSVMVIYPESEIVVAILVNLGEVNLSPLGHYIAGEFANLV